MKHLPNDKQEYQIARLVVEIAANPDKYKEVVAYSLTHDGAKKYKAVASQFIKSNDWMLEEDEMSITIWTGAKIKVDDMYDIEYIDEWSKV